MVGPTRRCASMNVCIGIRWADGIVPSSRSPGMSDNSFKIEIMESSSSQASRYRYRCQRTIQEGVVVISKSLTK